MQLAEFIEVTIEVVRFLTVAKIFSVYILASKIKCSDTWSVRSE